MAKFTDKTLHNLHPDMQESFCNTNHVMCSGLAAILAKGNHKPRAKLFTSTHQINASLKYIHCNLILSTLLLAAHNLDKHYYKKIIFTFLEMPDVKVVDNTTQNSFNVASNGDMSVRNNCNNSEAIGD